LHSTKNNCFVRIQRSITIKDSLSVVADGADFLQYAFPYACQTDKEASGLKHQAKYNIIPCFQ
jgi:hypothetical protein